MAVDAGLTVGAAAAASFLWKVLRHVLELALREAEGAAVGSAKARLGQAIKKLLGLKGEEEKAFERAFAKARDEFLRLPGPRLQQMEWLELLLDGKSPANKEFAKAAVKAYLFEEPPAKSRLPWLYQRVVTVTGAEMPAWKEFQFTVAEFIELLKEELCKVKAWRELFDSAALGYLPTIAEYTSQTVKEIRGLHDEIIPTIEQQTALLIEGFASAIRSRMETSPAEEVSQEFAELIYLLHRLKEVADLAELLEAIKDKFSRFYRQVIRKELDAGQSGRIIELQWKVYDGPMPHYTVIKQTWGEVDETLDKLLTWFENECSEDDPYKNSARVTTLIRIGKHLQQEVANLSDDNFESIRKCTMQFEENLNSFIRYVHWQLKKYIARSFILASRWERGINDE